MLAWGDIGILLSNKIMTDYTFPELKNIPPDCKFSPTVSSSDMVLTERRHGRHEMCEK